MESLRQWFERRPEEKRLLFAAFAGTAAASFAAHGFLFSNEFFSHDSVTYTGLGIHFYAGVGRFVIPYYEFIRGNAAAPWTIGLLFLLWMGLAARITAALLDIRSASGTAFTAALLCTNFALTLTGASYIYCMDEYALALLLAASAAYLFRRGGWQSAAGLLPLVLSLAIYQPYFTVAASLCLLAVIRQTARGESCKTAVRTGVRGIGLLAAGFGLYYALWALVCGALEVSRQRVEESALDGGLLQLPSMIWEKTLEYYDVLFHYPSVMGRFLPILNALLIAFLIWRLVLLLMALPMPNRLLLAGLVLLLPVAFNSASLLLSGGFNDLTAFARELLYLLPILSMEPGSRKRFAGWARSTLAVLLCLVLWQHVVFANQAYVKKDLEKNSTMVLAARILDRIETTDGYVPGQTPVAFSGILAYNWNVNLHRKEFDDISRWTGLWNSYSATYNLGNYLTQYLQYPILWDRENDYSGLKEVRAMPVFPAPGSVQMVDGTVVVKLSESH